MVLRVSFEDFPATVRRVCETVEVYVTALGSGSLVTAAHPGADRRVEARASLRPEEARAKLNQAGMEAHPGRWVSESNDAADEEPEEFWVGAVSYASSEPKPGLWIEAFPDAVTPGLVLKALYDEFVSTGELREMTFDDFIERADPNVVVLSFEELLAFRARRLAALTEPLEVPER